MELEKGIAENSTLLVIVPKETYHENIKSIVSALAQNTQKTCYICVNDPYAAVKAQLEKNDIKTNHFFFIDTLTKKVQEPPKVEDCIFVSAPNALTEISMAISKGLGEKKCDSMLFDTLSSLLIYENQHSLVQFVHNIITKLKVSTSKAVFIALKDDVQSDLIKDLYMFVDKVIDLSLSEQQKQPSNT